jgi:hypothetical protein
VTAWVFVVWGLLGAVSFARIPEASPADHIFLWVCCCAAVVLWILVLMRKWWARNALIGLLLVQYPAVIHNALGLSAGHGEFSAVRVALVAMIGAAVAGWQMFVLLTENPREWGKES